MKPRKRYTGEFKALAHRTDSLEPTKMWGQTTGNSSKNLGTIRPIVVNPLNLGKELVKSLPKKRFQTLIEPKLSQTTLSLA